MVLQEKEKRMGTRADFYIGQGKDAEWLGSVGWDGYEWDEKEGALAQAKTPDEFRAAVAVIAAERKDFTKPADGWPWPWENSATTDYAYALIDGAAVASVFGKPWQALGAQKDDEDDDTTTGAAPDFPDMSALKSVTFGKRSGLMVFST